MFGKLFSKFGRKKTKQQESFIEKTKFKEFHKTFGNVTIETVNRKNKGICLQASCGDAMIIMEHYENNVLDFPDGSNGYFFGNKLIIVTRWSRMTAAEKRKVETADLAIALHPYPCVQVSLKVGENWGDVLVNLHHCWDELNDENAPVDEAILLFSDTQDATYLTCRSVLLPAFVQKFLQRGNVSSHKLLNLDSKAREYQMKFAQDPKADFYNYLYDECWKESRFFHQEARKTDLEDIPDGIYIEINDANKVTNVYQND